MLGVFAVILAMMLGPALGPASASQRLYYIKDWGALTSGGVGPGDDYDVYIKPPSRICEIRSAIDGHTQNVYDSIGNQVMIRIDWYIDAHGWYDDGRITISFYGGETESVVIGGTSSGRLQVERDSGSPGQTYSYTITIEGWDYGNRRCDEDAQGSVHWY